MNNKMFLLYAADLNFSQAERYLAAQIIQGRPVCPKIKHYTEKLSRGLSADEVQIWVFRKAYAKTAADLIQHAKTAGCFYKAS